MTIIEWIDTKNANPLLDLHSVHVGIAFTANKYYYYVGDELFCKMSILSFVHDSSSTTNNEETFHQKGDALEFLKVMFPLYYMSDDGYPSDLQPQYSFTRL